MTEFTDFFSITKKTCNICILLNLEQAIMIFHKPVYFSLFFAYLVLLGCNAQHAQNQSDMSDKQNHKHTNALINESSPYLLQHAHNPVNWYPWGDEALQKAKDENKMLIISVGYAACHWCHVMEHESFEDSTVAAVMNEHFVSIKVDREERPDIDQIYMDACHLINQRGGWPLNAIALADGRPFYAGTYYPKDRWVQVLEYFINTKKEDAASLETNAAQIAEGIQSMEQVSLNPLKPEFLASDLDQMFDNWVGKIDFRLGGRQGAPKFPMPSNWLYLLRYHHLTENQKSLDAVYSTLDNMAFGGIYDHLGGGFARYSTDAVWKVPHFEKMLYDNGQLISLYSEAYQLSKNPLYKEVVYETLEYVKREMTSPEHGFYSSLDADSEGVEGKFYVWEQSEIDSLLGEQSKAFKDYYSVNKANEWEHKNILYRTNEKEKIAKRHDLNISDLDQLIDGGKQKLMKVRDTRIRPGLDDKILTSWNALMLKGYIDAYRVFGDKTFLETAEKNAGFLLDKVVQNDFRLTRNYKNGKASINAFLDDYALLIDAFVAMYQISFDEMWLDKADGLMQYVIIHFYDEKSGMFFYTSDLDDPLVARKMEIADNVIPSSNSAIARGLFNLGTLTYNKDYTAKAKTMLNNVKADVIASGPFYSNWAMLLYYSINAPYEVAILGKNAQDIRKELDQSYMPNVLFLGGEKEGSLALLENKLIPDQTTIYVCQNKVCKLPVTEVAKARELID